RGVDASLDGRFVGDIGNHGNGPAAPLAQVGGQRLRPGRIAIDRDDPHTVRAQYSCYGRAEPARGPGDDRHPVVAGGAVLCWILHAVLPVRMLAATGWVMGENWPGSVAAGALAASAWITRGRAAARYAATSSSTTFDQVNRSLARARPFSPICCARRRS